MRDREMGNESYMGDAMEVSVPDILSAGGVSHMLTSLGHQTNL